MKKYGIVMAGGSGERFWPLSTPDKPKQLLDLTGSGKSLLAEAIGRLAPVVDDVYVSTSERLAEAIVASGLVDAAHVLAEPCKRNTGGALIWCMSKLAMLDTKPFLAAITTADHAISPSSAFQSDVKAALSLALYEEALVVMGIPPVRADTGYGYVEWGVGCEVTRFAEKPDLATAEQFLAAGNYLWNSGMFFWRSDTFAAQLTKVAPPVGKALFVLSRVTQASEALRIFEALPDKSIDYLLMEKADKVRGVKASFRWDDVGTWDSLLRNAPLDASGNAVVGSATLIDCRGCVVYNASSRPLTLVGCTDMIHVATDEATLTCPVARAQDVREAARQAASANVP